MQHFFVSKRPRFIKPDTNINILNSKFNRVKGNKLPQVFPTLKQKNKKTKRLPSTISIPNDNVSQLQTFPTTLPPKFQTP